MASSSSSAAAAAVVGALQEDIAPLPLIRCPRCNVGVTKWFISTTAKNLGRHFYKCEFNGPAGCSFWKWENKYIEYLLARWGHVFAPPQPPAFAAQTPDLIMQNQRAARMNDLLLQNQRDLKLVVGLLFTILAALVLILLAK